MRRPHKTMVTAKRIASSIDGKLHMHHQKLGSTDVGGNLRVNGGDGIVVQREFANGESDDW